MTQLQLLILADDFTGASDAAAAFAPALDTLVVLSSGAKAERAEVLAVDLDLRECAEVQAQQKVESAAFELCSRSNPARVFLKIDSTLRGPIAGLVAGALRGSGKHVAVIAPAFPEQGRLLYEGKVVVDGQPGPSLLSALGMEGTALVGARFVRSDQDLARAVEHAHTRGAARVVVDADSSDILGDVASAWRAHPDWLLVGSGGLARQVAGVSAVPSSARLDALATSRPVLVVAGSPAAMTVAQIDRLRRIGSIVVVEAKLPVPVLPPSARDLLILCTQTTLERDAGESADAVARTVLAWSREVRPGALVLAGGATARRVCEHLGADGLRLVGELSPGVPVGRLVGGLWPGLLVVTKAGGFGNPNTLLDVVQALGVVSLQS